MNRQLNKRAVAHARAIVFFFFVALESKALMRKRPIIFIGGNFFYEGYTQCGRAAGSR